VTRGKRNLLLFFKAPSFYKSLQDPTNLKILSFDN